MVAMVNQSSKPLKKRPLALIDFNSTQNDDVQPRLKPDRPLSLASSVFSSKSTVPCSSSAATEVLDCSQQRRTVASPDLEPENLSVHSRRTAPAHCDGTASSACTRNSCDADVRRESYVPFSLYYQLPGVEHQQQQQLVSSPCHSPAAAATAHFHMPGSPLYRPYALPVRVSPSSEAIRHHPQQPFDSFELPPHLSPPVQPEQALPTCSASVSGCMSPAAVAASAGGGNILRTMLNQPSNSASMTELSPAAVGECVSETECSGSRHQCDACHKVYTTAAGLAKHRVAHCQQRRYPCETCHKVYTSQGALKMHIRTHTLPNKCEFCGKAFSRPWLLQGHIRTHTGEKPFECDLCQRSFADKSNLRAHKQTHNEVKKYKCARCLKTFSRMSLLGKHEEAGCCSSQSQLQQHHSPSLPAHHTQHMTVLG